MSADRPPNACAPVASPTGRLAVVGIGNPGPAYARTRHNAGVMLVERVAEELGVELKRPARAQYRVADARLEGRPVTLGVPISYMNESGRPVGQIVRKAGVRPEQLVVVHDELDLPLGRVRLKAGGGLAGHNGLKSIRDSLRSQDFLRIRIGIGRPETGLDAIGKVLTSFTPEERGVVDKAIAMAIDALRLLAREGLDPAQNWLHSSC